MTKKFLSILFLALIVNNVFSQITNADSVSMNIGTTVDVFYNLATGKKDTVSNRNWHLAFAVRNAQPPLRTMQASTVLINEGRGVSIYESNQTFANWNSFDTSGWKTWPSAFNSDSTWDIGAFNKNRNLSNPFDYGWGTYDMTSRDVTGSKVFLIAVDNPQNPFGASSGFRKVSIQKIAYDSMWVFTISRLDGTDSNTVTIKKKDFVGKLFAYYNMNTNTVIDREPIPAKDWNLLFTRYKALVTLGPTTIMYPVAGVLQNNNTMAYKIQGDSANSFRYDTLQFVSKIRTIDWDWKVITTAPGAWPVKDSLVYFTRVANKINKIKFTSYYAGTDRQSIVFNKTEYAGLSINETVKNKLQVSVYPNPANENIFVSLNENVKLAQVTISNLSGKSLISSEITADNKLDVSSLPMGMYLLTIATNNGSETVKFIKQ
ncbi:MAG: T9SS type A sorting domain-containing protein [Bacteroidia bacterium]|nr:T9SS type A sorting domain-containing protein [Bacteroidia bacterium]